MARAPVKRYPPNNVKAKPRPCKDCVAEGITSKRKAPHPGPRCASHHRVQRNKRKASTWEQRLIAVYGITAEEYWAIFDHQGGRCYICRRGNGSRKRLSVDHDHETGMVRGLLDTGCNKWVLGLLRDDTEALQRAIDYLNSPPAMEVIGCRIVPSTGAPVRGNTPKQAGAKRTITDGGEPEALTG